jgi:hypothetical protein
MAGRQTLVQRIALDGGKEIKTELESLGKAGEEAFKKLEQASKASVVGGSALGARLKDLQANFQRLGEAGARFGREFSNLSSAAGRFGTAAGAAVRQTALLAAGIKAAAAVAVGFGAALVNSATKTVDAAGKAAQAAGLTVESFSALQFAASQSGSSAEEFSVAMGRLNKAIADAFAGDGKASELFQRLGVSIKDVQGNLLPTEEILKRVADAFARLPDGAQKSALAIELLGRSGARLIPFLNNGRKGLEDLMKQAERTGVVFTQAQFRIAERFQDSLSALRASINATRAQLGLLFAPTLTRAAEYLAEVVNNNRKAIIAWGESIRQYVLERLADVINLINGNPEFVKARWMVDLTVALIKFGNTAQSAYKNIIEPTFKAITAVLRGFAGVVNSLFGTDLNAGQIAFAIFVAKITGALGLIAPAVALAVAAWKTLGATWLVVKGTGWLLWELLKLIGPAAITAFGSLGSAAIAGLTSLVAAFGKAGAAARTAFIGAFAAAQMFATLFAGTAAGAAVAKTFAALGLIARAAFLNPLVAGVTIGAFLGKLAYDSKDEIKRAFGLSGEDAGVEFNRKLQEAANRGQIVLANESLADFRARANAAAAEVKRIVDQMDAVDRGPLILANESMEEFRARANAAAAEVKGIVDEMDAANRSVSERIGEAWNAVWAAVRKYGSDALAEIRADMQREAEFYKARIESLRQLGATVWAGLASAADVAWQAVAQRFSTGWANVVAGMRSTWASFADYLSSSFDRVLGFIDSIISRIQSAIAAIRSALSSASSVEGGDTMAGFAPALARGGMIRGPGTGTSDSILARLSNGEYVMRAAAVRKFGPSFFAALNSLRLPAFNTGGLVDAFSMPQPSFAPAFNVPQPAALRPLSVNIGGQTFEMMAPEDTAQSLMRFAASKQVRSNGRKPGWHGG